LRSYSISDATLLHLACVGAAFANKDASCDQVVLQGHSGKADLLAATCGSDNLCAYLIAQEKATPTAQYDMSMGNQSHNIEVTADGQVCGYGAPGSWWLFTADGTFVAPASGTYEVTAIGGGGGGGNSSGGGGGGSSAIAASGVALVEATGGGGGGHRASGASGQAAARDLSLAAGRAYDVRIGAGGAAGSGGSTTSAGGGSGWRAGGASSGANRRERLRLGRLQRSPRREWPQKPRPWRQPGP
jgi:hypothetical protein